MLSGKHLYTPGTRLAGNWRFAPWLAGLLAAALFLVAGHFPEPGAGTEAAPEPEANGEQRGSLYLATTTSTYDSGLLDQVLPVFEEEYGWNVQVIARGTGQVLELGRRGDVDAVLVHDRETELEMVEAGQFVERKDVMYNDYVLAGPRNDPAGVARAPDAGSALGRIKEEEAVFVSRGDDSGTHRREQELWRKAGVDDFGPWYRSAGQGMADTLRLAGELEAYTLSDRATLLSLGPILKLQVLLEGDPDLGNQYGIMAVNPERHPHVEYEGARDLIGFFASDAGQEAVSSFSIAGEQVFFPGRLRAGEQAPPGAELPADASAPTIGEGIREAFGLVFSLDPYLYQIVGLSLVVSGAAVALATLVGVPAGVWLGLKPAGRTWLVSRLLYTFMGLPPVLAGLLLFLLLSRMGPLGSLDLLWTPGAMVLAQFLLAVPIVTGLTLMSMRTQGARVVETAHTLGAGRVLTAWTVIREGRFAILGAVVAALGRVMAEVGAVLMVGGNIAGQTRVMTTAIVLEAGKGNFALAAGLGLVLLVISFVINSLLHYFQAGRREGAV